MGMRRGVSLFIGLRGINGTSARCSETIVKYQVFRNYREVPR